MAEERRPTPLVADEVEALRRWQRWMRIGLALSLALLAGWITVAVVGGDDPGLEPLGGVFAVGIIAFGLIVQFGGRCPRCERRILPRALLALPARCPHCGVDYRRARADGRSS